MSDRHIPHRSGAGIRLAFVPRRERGHFLHALSMTAAANRKAQAKKADR
jgi:hypothetical protein